MVLIWKGPSMLWNWYGVLFWQFLVYGTGMDWKPHHMDKLWQVIFIWNWYGSDVHTFIFMPQLMSTFIWNWYGINVHIFSISWNMSVMWYWCGYQLSIYSPFNYICHNHMKLIWCINSIPHRFSLSLETKWLVWKWYDNSNYVFTVCHVSVMFIITESDVLWKWHGHSNLKYLLCRNNTRIYCMSRNWNW